ncbi:RNA/RNP complex-1-interacting phosphatase-like [Orcinus orca]|uniref:RNA/RNP complex-1-interacting phosphatase-like n=1 Tax=Orcinus orca TaxID=9733 RepID=UPI002112EBEC|nr:RNA/RNP complex-1-interacting phosphatase-like [Orcinus orca]XP_059869141.1 RNA/RNP complex-1-interacting phosphatase-like [Delphinus delphis]
MRRRRRCASCVGLCLGACVSGPCGGTGGAGLATLALLALGGRHLGGHMSQWHHARGRRGRRRGFSGRSSARRKGGKHIPERWEDYLPVEQRMPGTRFIAVKVPLKKRFDKNLAPEECFSPLDLF